MYEHKNQNSSEILSKKEIRRYNVQITNPQIGLTGQEKLKGSKVLVIGAGGKGASILQNLSLIGIGKIGICDNSFIEERDLNRQHLFGNIDLGKHKAITAKQKLQEINHLINFEVHNVFFEEKNVDFLCQNYDLLIDATDKLQAHCLISDTAIKLNKPLIYTSIIEFVGHISVFNYKDGPSFRDISPEFTKMSNSETVKGLLCQATIISVVGAIVANESIKVILGIDTQLKSNILTINALEYSFMLEPINK
jgi:molybdopterin/thiamine biosynthesis adenylyltransferase